MKRFDKTDDVVNAVLIGAGIDVPTEDLRITKTVIGAIDPTKEFLFMVSISPPPLRLLSLLPAASL